MKVTYFLAIAAILFVSTVSFAQEEHHETLEGSLKRHKVAAVLGYSLIHGVQNTQTGKEQYLIAPTFGLDYEYWISHKWAIGTYNEFAHVDIEVETEQHEEFIKRENAMLFSVVGIYEAFPRFSIFGGTGVETDPHHTFWIRYIGMEYSFIRSDDWDVSVNTGYINKDLYDAFTFGIVIGRRFGKNISSKKHH